MLGASLDDLGLALDESRQLKLVGLARMLIDWGRSTNLTGHRSVVEATRHLVVGALALQKSIESQVGSQEGCTLVDLGSGAGFPGIPIAIANPSCPVTLVESRERRHHFQRAVRRDLGVANLDPRWGRMEALAPSPADWVIAQAVAAPPRVLEWAMEQKKRVLFVPDRYLGENTAHKLGLDAERRVVSAVDNGTHTGSEHPQDPAGSDAIG